jgi:hypothetical protein
MFSNSAVALSKYPRASAALAALDVAACEIIAVLLEHPVNRQATMTAK